MVLRDVAPVLHGAPAGPRLDTIPPRGPDALAPDDILELERAAVVHDPLGDLPARHGRDLHPS